MHSAKLSRSRSRSRRMSSLSKEDEEFTESSLSSLSRPSTQDSKRSSYSRLSTDSGAGSLDDFNNRRNSSPDFWKNSIGRRHTAPTRKLLSSEVDDEELLRPNTVHVWSSCSPRCSLSRYAPLPAIGTQQEKLQTHKYERPVPVRRQCFMGPLDIDTEDTVSNDVNENDINYHQDNDETSHPPLFSLTLNSDSDSDFEEEPENVQQSVSESEECPEKPRRTLIRSATFTIEKERPDIRGPFLSVAIRLPDGTRVADKFDCKETLGNVCEFAIDKMEGRRPQKYSVATTDVPKRTFRDMTLSLKEAGIDDKTLLHLQLSDDYDSE
ncbi:UBX domain-containing protein [Trichonephila inaurata madagascariensis]|uniref:UBX domain-containing protein n=1 Tax=Trichonephila inaurata madagascariensis TaxID=2747483 RepID=A0A8X6XXL5_9ARAC|nr:UBX domain-containing protein [Trichonephila inaurata madagascariensis]